MKGSDVKGSKERRWNVRRRCSLLRMLWLERHSLRLLPWLVLRPEKGVSLVFIFDVNLLEEDGKWEIGKKLTATVPVALAPVALADASPCE